MMSVPMYFICRASDLPSVNDVNVASSSEGFATRIDDGDLWIERPFGTRNILRDSTESILHLTKTTVAEQAGYFARILAAVDPEFPTRFDIGHTEAEYGDIVFETCYSMDRDGLSVAEAHYALAKAAKAHRWHPDAAKPVLSHVETLAELAFGVEYQRQQTTSLSGQGK